MKNKLYRYIAILILQSRGLSKDQAEKHLSLYLIRKHYVAFGYDLSAYTDQQIENSIMEASRVIANIGIATDQALEAADVARDVFGKADVG